MRLPTRRELLNFVLKPWFRPNSEMVVIDGTSFDCEDVEIINNYIYLDKRTQVYFFYDQCSLRADIK